MVHIEVAAWFAQDNLKGKRNMCGGHSKSYPFYFYLPGDNVTELRVKFIRKIEDTVPAGDD